MEVSPVQRAATALIANGFPACQDKSVDNIVVILGPQRHVSAPGNAPRDMPLLLFLCMLELYLR